MFSLPTLDINCSHIKHINLCNTMHKLFRYASDLRQNCFSTNSQNVELQLTHLPTQQPSWSAQNVMGAKLFHLWSCGCLGIVAWGKRKCHCCMLLAKDKILIQKWTFNCHTMWMAFYQKLQKPVMIPSIRGHLPVTSHYGGDYHSLWVWTPSPLWSHLVSLKSYGVDHCLHIL